MQVHEKGILAARVIAIFFVVVFRCPISCQSFVPSQIPASTYRRHSLLHAVSSTTPQSSPADKTTDDGNVELSPLLTLDLETNDKNGMDQSPDSVDDGRDFSFYYRDEDEILTEREDRLYTDENGIRKKIERCILVGVEDLAAQRKAKNSELYYDPLNAEAEPPLFSLEESMIEMRELIKTAGLYLSGEIIQRQKEVNPRTYIGSGKAEEARTLMEDLDCCTIVFDAELSPGEWNLYGTHTTQLTIPTLSSHHLFFLRNIIYSFICC